MHVWFIKLEINVHKNLQDLRTSKAVGMIQSNGGLQIS